MIICCEHRGVLSRTLGCRQTRRQRNKPLHSRSRQWQREIAPSTYGTPRCYCAQRLCRCRSAIDEKWVVRTKKPLSREGNTKRKNITIHTRQMTPLQHLSLSQPAFSGSLPEYKFAFLPSSTTPTYATAVSDVLRDGLTLTATDLSPFVFLRPPSGAFQRPPRDGYIPEGCRRPRARTQAAHRLDVRGPHAVGAGSAGGVQRVPHGEEGARPCRAVGGITVLV